MLDLEDAVLSKGADPVELTLTEREALVLHDFLRDHLPDLRREVARTEQHELRHILAEREDLIERLLAQLEQVIGPGEKAPDRAR